MQPNPKWIYVAAYDDGIQRELGPSCFEDVGGYVVLSPLKEP